MGNRKFQIGNRPGQVRRFDLDTDHDLTSPDAVARAGQVLAELPVVLRELRSSSSPSAESAHRLLAVLGRLSRLDPCHLPLPTHPTDLLEEAEGFARQNAAALLAAAAEPNRVAAWKELWLKNGTSLAKSYEDYADPDTRTSQAQALLASLDEMDLVRYAARRLNCAQTHLDEAVAACATWLAAHAHAVLAAEMDVRRELEMMRRDLIIIDRELAGTVAKFMQVMNAVDEMEMALEGMGRGIGEEKGQGRLGVGAQGRHQR